MDKESLISKLRKLKVLSERGEEGESLKAKILIKKLADSYNIDLDKVFNQEERKIYKFKYSNALEKTIFFQCLLNIFGSKSEQYQNCFRYVNGKMEMCLKLTELEYLLFEDFYSFHRKQFKEELLKQSELILRAYVHNQKLYNITKEENQKNNKSEELSIDEITSILRFSQNMDNKGIKKYRKALE